MCVLCIWKNFLILILFINQRLYNIGINHIPDAYFAVRRFNKTRHTFIIKSVTSLTHISFLLRLAMRINTLFFKTDYIWHVIAMNRAAWIKCISSQTVTAGRHICFVKITQFILIFPRNLIQFVRQSCRNLFICLCLFKNNTDGSMGPTQRELHYGSSLDTKKCVCCLHSRLLSCFEKRDVVAKQHVLFILAAAFLFCSYYILPPFHIFWLFVQLLVLWEACNSGPNPSQTPFTSPNKALRLTRTNTMQIPATSNDFTYSFSTLKYPT